MRRYLIQANTLAKQIEQEEGKTVVGVRVFSNTLLLYFSEGKCLFRSKEGLNWGPTGSMYFPTINFRVSSISKRLHSQYKDLIQWTKDYVEGSIFAKIFLLMEYTAKYAL